MPTGYTASVQDGTITEFKDFALQCARAFGALVTMRDDPADAEIPEEFKPNKFYQEHLDEARTALAEFEALDEIGVREAAATSNQRAVERYRNCLDEKAETRRRYVAMLEKVAAWIPPSPEHEEMKKFMRDQLNQSIEFDCSTEYMEPPAQLTANEWLNKRREELQKSLKYAEEGLQKEIERCAQRNAWVKALRASL
jgi:hypothetical protein